MTRILSGVVLLLLVLGVTSGTFAQLPTGTILGVVKDSSGAVVPGANLTIRDVDTDVTRTVATGDDGAYRVPALPVGHYTVKVEKTGFKTETLTGLTLEVDQNLVVNSSLQVGTETQQVTVTGEAPVVNTTSGSLGQTVNEEKIADLPLNGRDWVDLTLMQPGITQHKNIGSGSPIPSLGTFYSSNGAPIRSNNYMIDGAMMVIFYGGVAASVDSSTLGIDGIQEYKVQTSNFSAEYGLVMGSQTTIVSKAGTNSFHGSAFEYLRNSSLDARNFFDTPTSSGGKRLPPFKRNNFGGSFGGPIKKDKTFFFATFEDVQERKGLTLLGTAIPANCRVASANPCATNPSTVTVVPTIGTTYTTGTVNPNIVPLLGNVPGTTTPYFPLPTPGLASNGFTYPFTRPVSEQYGQLRVDQTISAKDTIFARYTIDHANLFQPVNTTPNPNVTDHLYSSSQFDTVSETHVFSPSLVNTARGSLSITEPQNYHQNPPYPCPGGGTCSFLAGFPTIGIGGVTVGGGVTAFPSGVRVDYNQRIWSFSDDAFYTRGRHAVKFGALINYWIQEQRYINSNRGALTFSNVANFLEGNYSSISALTPGPDTVAGPFRNYRSGTLGFYVEDDLRATSRLTLNLGLRYEVLAPNIHEVSDLEANIRNVATDQFTTLGPNLKNPGKLDFGPRLGFAWDIFGSGKTSLRGGAARLFDIGNLGAAISESARGMPIGTSGLGATTTTITANQATGSCAAPAFVLPFTFPPCWLANTLFALDYNTKQPQLYVFNLTLEQQLPGNVGLAVSYVGSRGNHIWTRVDDNPCIPTAIVNGAPDWANSGNLVCPNGRINKFWSYMNMAQTSSQTWYNALQVVATKRVSHGLQFQGNYTYSHNVDRGNGQQPSDSLIAGGSTSNIAPGFSQFDRGSASFDVTHNFRFNAIYNLSKTSAKGFVGGLANGWWVSTILSVQSGYPFTPLLSSNRSLSGSLGNTSDRPSLAPGRSLSSITSGTSPGCGTGANAVAAGAALGTPNLWYDPCAFVTEPFGFLGSAGRNIIRGPGVLNDDFSVVKDTPMKILGETGKLEFRGEIFNIFNRANFAMPNTSVLAGTGAANETPNSGAGAILATSTTSRQVQLSLRLSF